MDKLEIENGIEFEYLQELQTIAQKALDKLHYACIKSNLQVNLNIEEYTTITNLGKDFKRFVIKMELQK